MTNTLIAAASKIMLGSTEAIKMYIGSTLIWPSGGSGQVVHNYANDYFTIESLLDSNTIGMTKAKSPSINISLSYSTDDGQTWTDITVSSSTTFTTINTGDKIIFKGVNARLATAWDCYYKFSPDKNFKVYGNAMSLLHGDNFTNNPEFPSGSNNNFAGLFYGTTTLTDASNLILPATICTSGCYNGMFRGCTNLTVAPELPATQSATDCYSSMFEANINLEVAPEINLTNMSQNCCKRMFCMNRNSKITTPKMTKSPILRCATSATGCYEEMFKGNGNLVEVTCLKTDDIGCCGGWLVNVSSTGVLKKSPLKNNWEHTTSGYPYEWTVEDYVES